MAREPELSIKVKVDPQIKPSKLKTDIEEQIKKSGEKPQIDIDPNAVSAILNNFDVAESSMESAANSANVAWDENEKYLDSIQGRLAQLDASFQVLSTDILSSGLVKGSVSFLTTIVKILDKIVSLTGALPLGLGIGTFITQLGEPKMTGFMIVPSNTPGGDTEQARCSFYLHSVTREYLVKPTNMAA